MTVQIKVLKGFNNPTNDEHNSLSLLVKSDYELIDHLRNSKEKILIALTKIIEHYQLEIFFYHKLQVKIDLRPYYISTKRFKLSKPKLDLENSFKDLISMGHNKFTSHFINFIIIENGSTLRMSKDEFHIISNIIMNDNKKSLFVDEDDKDQFEKTSNKEDDDDNFEKAFNNIRKRNSQLKKQIKENK